MARQRQVFPTSEIPHKWAHQTQESARNPQGNLYFKGATLYSYRDSYPIAKIFKKPGKQTLVLHVENTYSSTTAGHCSAARRACSHMDSLTVPDVRPDDRYSHAATQHAGNVRYLVELAEKHLDKAGRAMQLFNVAWRRDAAKQALADAQTYSAFFGIRRKVPAFPEIAWSAAAARAERIENPDPASVDKRERERAKRKAAAGEVIEYRKAMAESMKAAGHWIGFRGIKYWQKTLERTTGATGRPWYADQCALNDWRLFEPFNAGGYARSGMALRVNGEQIETSQGARIPLAAAPMVWEMVKRHLGRGWSAKSDGLCVRKVGDYPLTRIEADGTLVVGCHTIPHSELRSMARQLNLA